MGRVLFRLLQFLLYGIEPVDGYATGSVKLCVETKVKYLGLYVTSGSEFKIDLTVAKRKYYGCFNTIKSTAGNKMNEIMLLHILKTYCLPRLLYGCEIWPLDTMSFHDINVIWNNAFRSVFNRCWRESVKPLQFYCNSLPLSYLVEELSLIHI